MDYGKYKYELKKNQASKKQKTQTVKEIKLRPNIGIHDLNVKLNHIKEFLSHGHKIKLRPNIGIHDLNVKLNHIMEFLEHGHKTRVRIFFRGREIVHPELGKQLAEKIYEELKDISTVDLEPKLEGKNLIMVLSPLKKS